VRGVVFDFGFGLLVLASSLSCVSAVLTADGMNPAYLVGIATDERAQSGLSGARGRVDVRLKSGSVLVRHVVDVVVEGFLLLGKVVDYGCERMAK
jgi:hypothetical protein